MNASLTHAIVAVENSQSQKVYDLFSGTVEENQGQLVLNDCTLAKYSYPLHFLITRKMKSRLEAYCDKSRTSGLISEQEPIVKPRNFI